MALKGRAINEQKIGQAVFGRSQDYDSAVDGIVRSQASRLRQRLDLYFEHEGADEPVRIVIPRGRYVPVFEPRTAEPPHRLTCEPAAEPPNMGAASPLENAIVPVLPSPTRWLSWAVTAFLALALIALWVHDRRPTHTASVAAPVQHPLWSHLFRRDRPTIVVAPDSGLMMYHGLSGKDIGLKDYLDAGYRSGQNDSRPTGSAASRKELLLRLANSRYTSMVDLQAILTLKDLAGALGSEVSVRYARDLRPNDLKTGTVVLLGAPSANPWNELFERNMNFVLTDDYSTVMTVVNRSPKAGEPAKWESLRSDPQRHVYGLIAYMPSLSGDGNALLLEGTSMSGTEAAMDFAKDDAQLLPFLDRIRRSDGTLPHFEVVLGTRNMGASATQIDILAWRIMD